MSARPVTDAQISRALRAHLPEQATAGLRERVMEAAETTAQLRSFPSFLGALSEADPVTRRRNLLIAAALLVALAFASAAAAGAWRFFERDPLDELSLEPPTDLPAFVLSSYERLPQLPPLALTWHDSGSAKGRIYVDRSGAVRFDRFTSADATEPSSYTILNPNHRISGMAAAGSEAVWVEQGHEAIEDDPRVFLRTVLRAPREGPGCEMERDPGAVGNGTTATGWRYVGLEYVAGRPTHHVACVGDLSLDHDLWLDIETRLILRTREPLSEAGQFRTTEVTEIAFGEQPAELFEPPEGVTRMSEDEYYAYLCTRDLPDEERVGVPGVLEGCSTPEAEATPLPTPTPMPTVRPSLGPGPSGPPGPLAWSEASLKEDWPAPVRPEPAGGASVQPMPLTYLDPTGDTGSDTDPWVDIHGLMADTGGVDLKLVSNKPPVVDPTERWIAYGVVIDDDRDGVPDWRYGIDNTPASDGPPYRVWRTNLHTGHTDAGPVIDTNPRIPVNLYSGPVEAQSAFQASYPSSYYGSGSDAGFGFSGSLSVAVPDDEPMPSGGKHVAWGIELDMPFYTWASVIVNGRVVATDFAPDAGWLVATRGAKPGGTFLLGDPFPIHLAMTVRDGWQAGGAIEGHGWTGVATLSSDSSKAGLAFVSVDNHAAGAACTEQDTIDPLLGPGVDDLVTFLEGLPSIDISENKDATLDGYRGTYLELEGRETSPDCAAGWSFSLRGDLYHQVWILDVDGVRLVIDAFSLAPSEAVKSELRQMVESIHFDR